MNKDYKTEQETFWAQEFGDSYIGRNDSKNLISANISLFSKALKYCGNVRSVIEFGSNIGGNLIALKKLYPEQSQYAIEINLNAADSLIKLLPECTVYKQSILDFDPTKVREGRGVDLVLIKGVLIHIHPENLNKVYEKLTALANTFLLVCEYYNPTPVDILYRGHKDRLFKRDFAGEILDQNPEFKLVDYGFVYHRDPAFPQDDITWFLMERTN